MAKYRKKPVVIEAMQFNNDNDGREIRKWAEGKVRMSTEIISPKKPNIEEVVLRIETLEGIMTAHFSDWIIKGVSGEFYPCKPDIFEQTYESF